MSENKLPNVFAAIDIGSNAARLLIKKLDRDTQHLKKLILVRVPLRLGFDVFEREYVSKEKAEKLMRLIKAYRQLIKIYEVDVFRACATSAMRDARNGSNLIDKIRKKTGIDIEIVSGAEEAKIVYENHFEHGNRPGNYLYVDVGGGSTETNLIADNQLLHTYSYNIGTVRILTGKMKPSQWSKMIDDIGALGNKYPDIAIIGSGGNINKLYKMAVDKNDEEKSMPTAELKRIYDELASLSVEERMRIYDLRSDRADVIIPAAEIFLKIAELCHATKIYVPQIGVADGIIDELVENSLM